MSFERLAYAACSVAPRQVTVVTQHALSARRSTLADPFTLMLLALRLVMMAFATLCEANAPPSARAIPSMNIPNPLEVMSRVDDISPAPDGSR